MVKRKKLLDHVKTISYLDNTQLNIFVHDIKSIVDPIKTSSEAIDYYFTNTDFTKNDNQLAFDKTELLKQS
jgi:hypothetical protein